MIKASKPEFNLLLGKGNKFPELDINSEDHVYLIGGRFYANCRLRAGMRIVIHPTATSSPSIGGTTHYRQLQLVDDGFSLQVLGNVPRCLADRMKQFRGEILV